MKKKRFEIVCPRVRGWGLPQRGRVAEADRSAKFGARLDWDPVLDPIRGRKRPTEVELRMLRAERGG